ncbi:glycine cleavage system protein GcvH [Inquilinus sp. NPDC058860]|uniref:glycine cleavage system protein GcvH n=1 Tax=Inquilinus sp. NPDC058860 TaxID=3346652 RepID=UPI0036C4FA31
MSTLRYTQDHEWIRVEGDIATIGITDFAQKQLGDVVFVELPEVGKTLGAGDAFGTVESVKAASEVFAPVAGEVVETNQTLVDAPETVNDEPMGEGWFIKVKLSDPAAVNGLMDEAAYKAYVEDQH